MFGEFMPAPEADYQSHKGERPLRLPADVLLDVSTELRHTIETLRFNTPADTVEHRVRRTPQGAGGVTDVRITSSPDEPYRGNIRLVTTRGGDRETSTYQFTHHGWLEHRPDGLGVLIDHSDMLNLLADSIKPIEPLLDHPVDADSHLEALANTLWGDEPSTECKETYRRDNYMVFGGVDKLHPFDNETMTRLEFVHKRHGFQAALICVATEMETSTDDDTLGVSYIHNIDKMFQFMTTKDRVGEARVVLEGRDPRLTEYLHSKSHEVDAKDAYLTTLQQLVEEKTAFNQPRRP